MQRSVILNALDSLMHLDPEISVGTLYSVPWLQAHDVDVEPCNHELRVLQGIGEGSLIDMSVIIQQLLVGSIKSYLAGLGVKIEDVVGLVSVGSDEVGLNFIRVVASRGLC